MNCTYLTLTGKCSKLREIVEAVTGSTQEIECIYYDLIKHNIEPNCQIFKESV